MILIKDITLITQNARRQIIKKAGLVIEGSIIKAIGQAKDIEKRYGQSAEKVIDGHGKVALPGLINAHGHLAMTLLRGYADDLSLEEWWMKYVYPVESQFTARHIYWGSLLAAIEMVKSGTTCFVDFYYHEDKVAQAAKEVGLRAMLGQAGLDPPTFEYKTMEQALGAARTLIEKYQDDDFVKVSLAPHMFQTTSVEYYQKFKELARQYDLLLATHTAETRQEVGYCLKKYKKRPVEVLAKAGILDKRTLLAHCCWLNKGEIKLLAQSGASVVHCPVSNMKLAAGIMPLPEMLASGINIALGTDSACSNNNLDMFEEMKAAALLHKVDNLDPTIADAQTVLDMATINGARALGLEKEIGSLEKGKKADLIILDFEQPHLRPAHNIVSHLVYAAKGSDVEMAIINGKIIMEKRRIKRVDQDKILPKIEKLAMIKKR